MLGSGWGQGWAGLKGWTFSSSFCSRCCGSHAGPGCSLQPELPPQGQQTGRAGGSLPSRAHSLIRQLNRESPVLEEEAKLGSLAFLEEI